MLSGTNGAGKSSIGGARLRAMHGEFYNPDEVAKALREANPSLTSSAANGLAWSKGKELLERAIAERKDFSFETTLGGRSMTRALHNAARAGFEVVVWFAGLSSPELHLARIRARVAAGGHDIAEADVRRRYDESRLNVISLLPLLAELAVYDNSIEGPPLEGRAPRPLLVLHWRGGRIVAPRDLAATPGWARPIVVAAMKAAKAKR